LNKSRYNRIARRVLAFGLSLALICTALPAATAISQADIDALEQQQSELQSQMSSLESQISDLESQENTALEQALLYQQQMGILAEQIDDTQTVIADYEVQIADTQAELEDAQAKSESYYQIFCERVRDLEEAGSISYWSILFDAASFSDLLDRISFIRDVVNYDNSVVDALEAARQAVADAEAQLEQEKAGQEAALAELEEQQDALQVASDNNQARLAEIQANQEIYADKLAALESESDDLAADIVSSKAAYQAQLEELQRKAAEDQRKKEEKEEEARRKAEEAAAAAAAAAAANNNNYNNNDDNAGGNDDGDNGGGGNTGTTEPEPETTPSVPSSSIGASVAAYACQFIGNPYVWGGESLTNGADCSGFVKAVYAHFGISLPHSSWSLRSCGTAVSYSDAQPGDLIFYQSSGSPTGGHVGIYIGGGQMVSALSSKYGICISTVNSSKAGFTVRRIA
jgi:cell wall-associated NlpC family hydrolase